VALGTELPILAMLGFVVLGPKRLHSVLRHLARAKAEFENASLGIKSRLAAELGGANITENADGPPRLGEASGVEPDEETVLPAAEQES
jgi:Sec-independent protein translocase protein TatA